MAQINLLKQNQPGGLGEISVISFLGRLMIAALLAMVGYYGWMLYRLRGIDSQTNSLNKKIISQKMALSQFDRKDEVLTRQAQLKEFNTLIDNHPYWSQLLPELAKMTLKKASYLSFHSVEGNKIGLAVEVPDMVELDKFLQVFDSPKLNKYFRDVTIGGVGKMQDKDRTFIRAQVQLKYDPSIIKYKASNK